MLEDFMSINRPHRKCVKTSKTDVHNSTAVTIALKESYKPLRQGSPKYGPRATSGPLRPLIWPAELSLKKQTKLGKLKILTPLYSDMHIAKIHVAVCKALCLICNDTIAVLKEYNIRRHYESKHSSHYSI